MRVLRASSVVRRGGRRVLRACTVQYSLFLCRQSYYSRAVGCGQWAVWAVWAVGYGICTVWDMGCGMWDVGCGIWDLGALGSGGYRQYRSTRTVLKRKEGRLPSVSTRMVVRTRVVMVHENCTVVVLKGTDPKVNSLCDVGSLYSCYSYSTHTLVLCDVERSRIRGVFCVGSEAVRVQWWATLGRAEPWAVPQHTLPAAY